jgi:hypothetical protein
MSNLAELYTTRTVHISELEIGTYLRISYVERGSHSIMKAGDVVVLREVKKNCHASTALMCPGCRHNNWYMQISPSYLTEQSLWTGTCFFDLTTLDGRKITYNRRKKKL